MVLRFIVFINVKNDDVFFAPNFLTMLFLVFSFSWRVFILRRHGGRTILFVYKKILRIVNTSKNVLEVY